MYFFADPVQRHLEGLGHKEVEAPPAPLEAPSTERGAGIRKFLGLQ